MKWTQMKWICFQIRAACTLRDTVAAHGERGKFSRTRVSGQFVCFFIPFHFQHVLSVSVIDCSKTFRSSKNRRKHERKLLSLKPGNPFEDIALIDALHNHVTKLAAQQQQQQVHDTCKALLQLHTEDEQAASLQRLYASILEEMQTALDDIWIPELMGGTAQHLTGPNVDYLALRKEQRYALISACLLHSNIIQ